jgi:peptidoglycan/xylan/chitin deacetylase (PgdA/CDA1 family)
MCGAAVTLATGGYHYAAMWPESQIFGPTLIAGKDSAELALTYDDGPNEPYTLQLLEVLERHNVHATFFMIGDYVRRKPSIVRAVRQQGHTIGSHTMTHPHLMYSSRSRLQSEMHDATSLIEDVLGEPLQLFRPPFGSRRPEVLRYAAEVGLVPVMWNVTGFDWNAKSAREIEMTIERGIVHNQNRGHGTNLLLHDGGHQGMGADRRRTVSATATLLAMLPRTGMHLVTVDHWLKPDQKLRPRNVPGFADRAAPTQESMPIPFPASEEPRATVSPGELET